MENPFVTQPSQFKIYVKRPHQTDSLQIFKEAKAVVKKLKKEYKKELLTIYQQQKKVRQDTFHRAKTLKDIEIQEELAVILHTDVARQTELEHLITGYDKMLQRVKIPKGTSDLEVAKQIPITDYIEFNRSGFANCIWHNERTPSMKYYPKENRVWCFGCGCGGDSVDVVAQINNCSVGEALKLMKNA